MIASRGCSAENVSVVRDGVDTDMFKPMVVGDEFYDEHHLDKDTEYVVYQGGIAAHDGVQFLIDAAPKILAQRPNVHFLIVGAGDHVEKLKDQVSQMKLWRNFTFTGWVPYTEMPKFMNIAKINAVPIPDAPATQGVITLKILEAAASGTPTIIGDLPGVREYMTHGKNAYLARSEDTDALSSGVLELLENGKLYSTIKIGGLDMTPRYDWRVVAKDFAKELVGDKK